MKLKGFVFFIIANTKRTATINYGFRVDQGQNNNQKIPLVGS